MTNTELYNALIQRSIIEYTVFINSLFIPNKVCLALKNTQLSNDYWVSRGSKLFLTGTMFIDITNVPPNLEYDKSAII